MSAATAIRCVMFVIGLRCLFAALRRPTRRAAKPPGERGLSAAQWAGQIVPCSPHAREELEGIARQAVITIPGLATRAGSIRAVASCLVVARSAAGILAMAVGSLMIVSLGPVAAPLVIGGVIAVTDLPRRLLDARVRRAQREIGHAFPAALDLIAAALAAGLPLERGFACLAQSGPPAIRPPMRYALAAVSAGVGPASAMRQIAEVAAVPALSAVAALMERAIATGAPLSASLHGTASDLRASAQAAARQRAGQRGPLATLTTALVIAPSCVGLMLTLVIGGALTHGQGIGG